MYSVLPELGLTVKLTAWFRHTVSSLCVSVYVNPGTTLTSIVYLLNKLVP